MATKSAPADTTASTPAPATSLPPLGSQVQVVVADGVVLINGDTGQPFAPGVATLQVVTLTTHRRLLDGDLALA